jgi:hypothetical protein
MAHATGLLRVPCPRQLRPALLSAVAYLSTAAGALIFDSYDHDLAARLFAFAADCAELAEDWHLRAKALSWRARQAVWCGDPDAGLTSRSRASCAATG